MVYQGEIYPKVRTIDKYQYIGNLKINRYINQRREGVRGNMNKLIVLNIHVYSYFTIGKNTL